MPFWGPLDTVSAIAYGMVSFYHVLGRGSVFIQPLYFALIAIGLVYVKHPTARRIGVFLGVFTICATAASYTFVVVHDHDISRFCLRSQEKCVTTYNYCNSAVAPVGGFEGWTCAGMLCFNDNDDKEVLVCQNIVSDWYFQETYANKHPYGLRSMVIVSIFIALRIVVPVLKKLCLRSS